MNRLVAIKVAHTVVWAFFAGCIVAVPVLAAVDRYVAATVLICAVAVEVGILVLNDMRCPLTAVAARYTDERRANFDIYLPVWLAEHNKSIFGTLYALGVVFTLVRWWMVRQP